MLCEARDAEAGWLASRLRARGRTVQVVTAHDLATAPGWDHRVAADGRAVTAICLADGRSLSSERPIPIVNRLGYAPFATLAALAGADLGYAAQETFASWLSWLHGWPAPVVNRPTPQGLGGNHRHPSAWRALAYRAGLDAESWRQDDLTLPEAAWLLPSGDAIAYAVEGIAVLPPHVDPALAPACARLAALADTALVGIHLRVAADGAWRFVGADPVPPLAPGGEPLVDAIEAALG